MDIGSSQSASLDALAFEDATKRNKPELKVCNYVRSQPLRLTVAEKTLLFLSYVRSEL